MTIPGVLKTISIVYSENYNGLTLGRGIDRDIDIPQDVLRGKGGAIHCYCRTTTGINKNGLRKKSGCMFTLSIHPLQIVCYQLKKHSSPISLPTYECIPLTGSVLGKSPLVISFLH